MTREALMLWLREHDACLEGLRRVASPAKGPQTYTPAMLYELHGSADDLVWFLRRLSLPAPTWWAINVGLAALVVAHFPSESLTKALESARRMTAEPPYQSNIAELEKAIFLCQQETSPGANATRLTLMSIIRCLTWHAGVPTASANAIASDMASITTYSLANNSYISRKVTCDLIRHVVPWPTVEPLIK